MISYEYKPVMRESSEVSRKIIKCDYCGKIIYDSNLNDQYREEAKETKMKWINFFRVESEKDTVSENDGTLKDITVMQEPEDYCSDECLIRAIIPKTSNRLKGILNPKWTIKVESQAFRGYNITERANNNE